MTKKQRQVYDFIQKFWKDHGHGPTYREIASGVGSYVGSTYSMVMALERSGHIVSERGRHRAIRLVDQDVN